MAEIASADVLKKIAEATAIQDAKAWLPQPGDLFTGRLVAIKKGTSKYGPYPLAIFQLTEGNAEAGKTGERISLVPGDYIAFHAFHGVPRARLMEARPEIGDVLSIKYDGKVPPKNKDEDEMNIYTIVVHNQPHANADWDQF